MAERSQQLQLLAADEEIGDCDRELFACGRRFVIGVDEVGRGPLAGPVTCAAVALDLASLSWCTDLNDSKRLSARRREVARAMIAEAAPAWAIVNVEAPQVDALNVLGASLHGMQLAAHEVMAACGWSADEVALLVDGNAALRGWNGVQRTLVKGDARSFAIAAASILAKVHRDAQMVRYESRYPGYGFARHKGYPTREHLTALQELGVSPIHRRSFAPVRAIGAAREKEG